MDGQAKKEGILLVDHGSRRESANRVLPELAKLVAAESGRFTAHAHMELAAPSIADAVAACAAAGVTELRVMPYFLSPGRHVKEDIPRLVEAAAADHPAMQISVTDALGGHPLLVKVILDRCRSSEHAD
ncbi:MAG: CbiX/SirB N-terminal domain-containing protein [Myxococcota bacterium]